MRKFLMAAALLTGAACGGKENKGGETGAMAPAAMPTTVGDSTKRADSLRADSTHRADSIKVADSIRVADSVAKAKGMKKKP